MTATLRSLYDLDFAEWTQATAELLRQHKFDEIDIENVAEEIESLGKRDRRELSSRLKVLLMHLLKWTYQPEQYTNSWRSSVKEQRRQIKAILKDSPSLKRHMIEEFSDCYQDARDMATDETGLEIAVFPIDCEWTIEQVLDSNYLPEVP
ncbi:MAG: DUF29 domain-containing protein [Acaryochloris sp. CRU_2_0]|nr:DUF29 domain-containing protein [Acaryochloris sp. CRU_2_0]